MDRDKMGEAPTIGHRSAAPPNYPQRARSPATPLSQTGFSNPPSRSKSSVRYWPAPNSSQRGVFAA